MRRGRVRMTKIYVRKIRAGEITMEQVPERWRKQVKELLGGER